VRGEVCVCGGGEVEHPSLIIEMPGQGGAREVATPLSVWRANTRFWVAAGKFKRFALSNFTAWETVWIHGWVIALISLLLVAAGF